MKTLLSEELLDKIWNRYVVQIEGQKMSWAGKPVFEHYRYVSRRSKIAQSFENWLFTHGGMVRRIENHTYLEFFTEEEAALFALVNS